MLGVWCRNGRDGRGGRDGCGSRDGCGYRTGFSLKGTLEKLLSWLSIHFGRVMGVNPSGGEWMAMNGERLKFEEVR